MRRIALAAVIVAAIGVRAPAQAGMCGFGIALSIAGDDAQPRDGLVLLQANLGIGDHIKAALLHAHFKTSGLDVPAHAVQVLEGGRLQILFAPVGPLPANDVVRLAFDDKELDDELAGHSFKTGDALAATGIVWIDKPHVVKPYVVPSNKADGSYGFELDLPFGDQRPTWVLATITRHDEPADPKTPKVVQVIYPVGATGKSHRAIVDVGKIGCESMYYIDVAGPRTVELTAIGASGETVPAPAPVALKFR